MAARKNRVVLLHRISTEMQNLQRQRDELEELCAQKGWIVVETLEEIGSGSKDYKKRTSIDRILSLAESGKIDRVVVQELSRLGRRTGQSISLCEKLGEMGVSVYEKARNIETLNEDGTPNAISSMILSVLASLHSMESSERNSRIVSGIKSRQRANLPFGRPEGSVEDVKKFVAKHSDLVKSFKTGEKLSLRKRAKLYGKSVNTVRKVEKLIPII